MSVANATLTHPNPHPTPTHPGLNGSHFADNAFICIFVNEKFCILIRISLKFVPKGPRRSSDICSTRCWPPGSLHTLESDGVGVGGGVGVG